MHLGGHLVDVCLFVERRRETDPQVAIFFTFGIPDSATAMSDCECTASLHG